ncbi:hypothetical protein [Streptomyces asoensis]|uniref:hypothetical protein n=1 Tax=Streptomyces asoensis TaxID=249586 RepID=UPI0033CEDCDB
MTQATTPPVLRWQEESDAAMAYHISRCHRVAEDTASRLEFAAKVAWRLATDAQADPSAKAKVRIDQRKPGPWASAALARYWPCAEREFWALAAPEQTAAAIERPFVEAALSALDEAIGHANRADIRVARARARARALLLALLPAARTA